MIHTFAADSIDHCDCREDCGTLYLAYRAQLVHGWFVSGTCSAVTHLSIYHAEIALKVAVQEEMQMRHLWVRHVLGMSWTLQHDCFFRIQKLVWNWLILFWLIGCKWGKIPPPTPGNVFRGHRILFAIIQPSEKMELVRQGADSENN